MQYRWEVATLVDDPVSSTGDCSAMIAEYLNQGWEIVAVNFAQSSVIFDGLPQHDYTRCVTLKRFVLGATPTPEPKQEAKEASLSALTPSPSPDGRGEQSGDLPPASEETVIECEPELEPVPVVQVLPANMVLLSADGKPLVVFPEGVTKDTPYAEAIKRVDVGAEHLAAIHEAEADKAAAARLEQFRNGEISFEEAVAAAGIRAAQGIKDQINFDAIRQRYQERMAEWQTVKPGFMRS